MSQLRIRFKDVEIGRGRARQTSQVVQAFSEREPTAELHPVGIDYLKPIPAAHIFLIEDVPYVQILVQNARNVQAEQKCSQGLENRKRFGNLSLGAHDGA